jgi:heme exporter protein D
MAKFLEMGGYAVYVWPSFAMAAVVMVGLLVTSLRTLRAREAVLKRLEAAEQPADDNA